VLNIIKSAASVPVKSLLTLNIKKQKLLFLVFGYFC